MNKIKLFGILTASIGLIGLFSWWTYRVPDGPSYKKIEAEPGRLSVLESKYSTWCYCIETRNQLQVVERKNELFLTPKKPGKYQIFSFEGKSCILFEIEIVSPSPPSPPAPPTPPTPPSPPAPPAPPSPPSPQNEFSTPWQQEFSANKKSELAQLIKLYEDGLKFSDDSNSYGELSKKLSARALELNVNSKLPNMHKAIGEYLGSKLPNSPSLILNKSLVRTTFTEVIKKLKELA